MFAKKQEPIAVVLHELLKLINARITYGSIKKKLLQQPTFPFLFSITNTLTNFGITNKAVKIKNEQLEQLEPPFLTTTNARETIVVKEIKNNLVNYFSPSSKWVNTSLDEFKKLWNNNIVVLIDPEAIVSEDNYKKKKTFEQLLFFKPFAFLLVFFSLIILLATSIGLRTFLLFFAIKILGLVVAVLLVNKEVNKKVSYSFCNIGKKISCDAVLNSPASKIFSWLSMTDMGFLYFCATFSALVLSCITLVDTTNTIIICLVFINFLTLPYTIFSSIYQAFVIKKWCFLCVVTIVLLWLEAAIGYYSFFQFSFRFDLKLEGVLIVLFSFLFTIVAWMFLKGTIVKSYKYDALRFPYLRIINNLEVFQFLQKKRKKYFSRFETR